MRLISFGETTLPQLAAKHRTPTRFRSSLIALQGGAYDLDGTDSYPEPKTVSASFWVTNNDHAGGIDGFINQLNGEQGTKTLVAQFRDGTYVFTEAKIMDVDVNPDVDIYVPDTVTDAEGYEPVTVTFEIPYPYWLDSSEQSGNQLNTNLQLNNGVLLNVTPGSSWSITALPQTEDAVNNGNSPAWRGTITITISNPGGVTNLRMTNNNTGDYIQYTGSLVADDVLVIDLLTTSIKLNGVNAYEDIEIGSTQTDLFYLEVGTNEIEFSGSGFTGTIAVDYQYASHYAR